MEKDLERCLSKPEEQKCAHYQQLATKCRAQYKNNNRVKRALKDNQTKVRSMLVKEIQLICAVSQIEILGNSKSSN